MKSLNRLLKKSPWLAIPLVALAWFNQSQQATSQPTIKPNSPSNSNSTFNNCSVKSIYDGDTMRVICANTEHKVRLYCIDTPEMQQKPWGKTSRDALRAISPGVVSLVKHDKDRYGRIIAEVLGNDKNLNLEMVKIGQAAVYPQYCKEPAYFDAQNTAQRQKLGIWSREGLHQAPWEWRSQRRK